MWEEQRMFQAKGAASAMSEGEKACFLSKNHKEFSTAVVWSAKKNGLCSEWVREGQTSRQGDQLVRCFSNPDER